MRPLTIAVAAFVAAACLGAIGSALDAAGVLHGAEAAAMLALAACTLLAGHSAPRPLRRALLAFCLLLAAAAVVRFAADQMPVPEPAPRGENGCPVETPETIGYWRDQLRLGQLAEMLRFLALACALQVGRLLPRAPHPTSVGRRIVIALLGIAWALVGLFPFFSAPASDVPALIPLTAPGILTLAAAVVLTALTVTSAGTGRVERATLLGGTALTLLPTAWAVENLAQAHRQIPETAPENTFTICAYAYNTAATSVSLAVSVLVVTALLLAGPALFTWSALRLRADGPG